MQKFVSGAPTGAVIGVVGDTESTGRLLELAAEGRGRWIGLGDPLDLSPQPVISIFHRLALEDAAGRLRAAAELELLRRDGSTVFLASHEPELLRALADEIWLVGDGTVLRQGDPGEMLRHLAAEASSHRRKEGAGQQSEMRPSLRRGDGRATLRSIDLLDQQRQPVRVWKSGEQATVAVTVEFAAPVDDPVVGIMVRTRIGVEVYGTNTELEGLKLGPCQAGNRRRVEFTFACALCPNEYTLTAASHDPNGVWHDWAEDAVAFSVTDNRYTAGVANLKARVTTSVPE